MCLHTLLPCWFCFTAGLEAVEPGDHGLNSEHASQNKLSLLWIVFFRCFVTVTENNTIKLVNFCKWGEVRETKYAEHFLLLDDGVKLVVFPFHKLLRRNKDNHRQMKIFLWWRRVLFFLFSSCKSPCGRKVCQMQYWLNEDTRRLLGLLCGAWNAKQLEFPRHNS